ncbi:helix-turn-helix transcriptional regulator [Hyphomonas sp.]|jgi:transcriptional regulator with XRE-family HTH domain|uniref:helix-turn-helix domain-containing protein n=1 Tax=Hyphomonas sp. TaxID=87 RepID=UPI0025C6EF80|nr:helix-turn-helix transcriptional regulator [Hyphomonas sp.]
MTNRKLSDANTVDRQVGERMRRRRILLGLTQDQLADALGISYQQIQKYETGANRVSAGRLAQIAEVMEVQPGWFFGATEKVESAAGSSRAVIDLVRNFSRIEDERIRTHLMALVRSLAGRSDEDADALTPAEPAANGDQRGLMG